MSRNTAQIVRSKEKLGGALPANTLPGVSQGGDGRGGVKIQYLPDSRPDAIMFVLESGRPTG